MKTKFFPVVIISMIMCGLSSCSDKTTDATSSLQASKTSSIKQGEPVVFTNANVSNASSSSVQWSVTPSSNTQISTSGNQASIIFCKEGTYTVQSTVNSLGSSVNVSVNDSVYSNTTTAKDQTIALTGDHITITPTVVDSLGNKYLTLFAVTTNKYDCLNNYLIYTLNSSSSSVDISLSGVCIPSSCNTQSQKVASAFFGLYLNDGTYMLNITLNSKTYTGSVTKLNGTFTFTWTDATNIVISPLTVK